MVELVGFDAAEAASRARARAEFAEWSAVLVCHEENRARIDASDAPLLRKELDRLHVTAELAQRLRVGENAVWRIVCLAERLRDRTPQVWTAFADGLIDAAKAAAISDTVAKLETTEATDALEANVVAKATALTVAELRSWLRRFRGRWEAEQVAAETARAVEDRRVEVSHNDDGTSWINALVPTPVAVAVQNRLKRAAKALPVVDPETGEVDRRTLAQKQADLIGHWLTSCTGTQTDIRAEIAIAIDATDLIGYTDGPGVTADREHTIPAGWVRELAACETTLFRRLVLDPRGRVLDTTSLGYQPPDSLRAALHWRDGTCRVAGCRKPATETDLDHAIPYDEGGRTNGANLRCLCRKHHNLKSHGLLPERFLTPALEHRDRWIAAG